MTPYRYWSRPWCPPIKHVAGFTYNPSAPYDPFLFQEAYGADRLRRLLDKLSLPALKEAATLVERRKPHTKAAHRRSKVPLAEYIERQVSARG